LFANFYLILYNKFLKDIGNVSAVLGGTPFVAPFPIKGYEHNTFYDILKTFLGIATCIAALYPASRLVKEVVEDKEAANKRNFQNDGNARIRFFCFMDNCLHCIVHIHRHYHVNH